MITCPHCEKYLHLHALCVFKIDGLPKSMYMYKQCLLTYDEIQLIKIRAAAMITLA